MTSLLGRIRYERAYYYDPSGKHGQFPADAEFGFARKQTPAAREVISLAGVQDAFECAAGKLLSKLSGLNVSTSTVRRTTEAVGQDVAERRAAGETFGPDRPWDWHVDADGRKVACVGLDATGVPQQGPHGEQAEGRMPNVATVFNPPPMPPMPPEESTSPVEPSAECVAAASLPEEPSPSHDGAARPRRRRRRSTTGSSASSATNRPRVWDRRTVAGLLSLPEIAAQLRRECQAVGVDRADVVVGLTDGGAGLENCLIDAVAGLAKDIEFVLDFYHVSEHLQEFANAFLPADETARQRQVADWCRTLKRRGGEPLLAELESLDLANARPTVVEAHRRLLGYLRNNRHRMDYPKYLARGWQIGSGMIESTCKTVVGQRLKESGMRWREPGTTALCQLRALDRSQPEAWTAYWSRNAPA